jgi:hypothetical protein
LPPCASGHHAFFRASAVCSTVQASNFLPGCASRKARRDQHRRARRRSAGTSSSSFFMGGETNASPIRSQDFDM